MSRGRLAKHLPVAVLSTANRLRAASDAAALTEFVATHTAFGRAMPEQKRLLIAALQAKGMSSRWWVMEPRHPRLEAG